MSEIQFPSPTALLGPSHSAAASTSTAVAAATTALPHAVRSSVSQANSARRKAAAAKTKQQKAKVDPSAKPKQSKSRNGCVTCKNKRLKCDETKPTCQQCAKRQVTCGGYKKDWKWKEFNEGMVINKPQAPARPRKSAAAKSDLPTPQSQSPTASSEGTGSTVTPKPLADTPRSFRPPSPVDSSKDDALPQHPLPYLQQHIPLGPQEDAGRFNRPYPLDLSLDETRMHLGPGTSLTPSLAGMRIPNQDLMTPRSSLSRSPEMSHFVQVTSHQDDMDNDGDSEDHGNWMELEMRTAPFRPDPDELEDEEIEEIVRAPESIEVSRPLRAANLASSMDLTDFEISEVILNYQPNLGPYSAEALMTQFQRETCGILSMRDGMHENPWRAELYPLVHESPALFHAIASMSAFHSSKQNRGMKLKALEHRSKSIELLNAGIHNMRADIAIAITLVLAFAESWDSDFAVSTGVHHLKGAKQFLTSALTTAQTLNTPPEIASRIRFLCNTWVYMDVIARLTTLESDDSEYFDSALWASYSQFGGLHEIDPLMGCSATMFPLIGRVANLSRRVRSRPDNSISMVSQATELKKLLEDWQPPYPFAEPDDERCDVDAAMQTAEAYRWSTLLYLHQAVPEIPSRTSGQLAKKVLIKLALVPLRSRTIIVQIYPLLAAGCEASNEEDRDWVKQRWNSMSRIMNIENIDRCLDVVQEVWKRRDHHDALMRNRSTNSHRRRGSGRPGSGGSNNGGGGTSSGMFSPMRGSFGAHDAPTFSHPGLANLGEVRNRREVHPAEEFDLHDKRTSDWVGYSRGRTPVVDLESLSPGNASRSRSHSNEIREKLDVERTVRGKQHWIGVMKDWNWEVLLG